MIDLTRYTPPGYDTKSERSIFIAGLALSTLYSLGFFYRLLGALDHIYGYDPETRTRVLLIDARMEDFAALADGFFLGFWLTALIFIFVFIPVRYAYFRQNGSRADYLMHRLPRAELHRRCLTVPIITAAVILLCAAVLLLLYFAIYHLATPAEALTPGQWYKIWEELL